MDKYRVAPLETVLDLLLDAVCVVDEQGRFVFVSAAFETLFGYSTEEVIGRNMIDFVVPEDRALTLAVAGEIMAGDAKPGFENRYLHKDGHVVHVMWSARWSPSDRMRVAVARDISARKRAEAMQTAMYALSEAVHDAVDPFELFALAHRVVTGLLPAECVIVAVRNDADGTLNIAYAADAQGLPLDGPPPQCIDFCTDVANGEDGRCHSTVDGASWLGSPLLSADGSLGAISIKRRKGEPPYAERDRELLQFVAGQVGTALERMRLQTRLRRMAQYDALTGLPNRALLHDRIDTAVAAARRNKGKLALLYLDLDHFKDVNDSLGHAAGDLLLHAIAQRLRACVRDADTVARLGGDEFVVLIPALVRLEDADLVADKIRAALRDPIVIEGHPLIVSTSIGIARWPENGDGAKDLLLVADAAMYAAKRRRSPA